KEISIQFTVEKKASTDLLESLDTKEIPKSFNVGGVEVPTDVLERSYQLGYKLVAEAEASPRKTRIDPIKPGVSVANKKVSAGTIGCIVFDKNDGTPYVLSNWHVLNGPTGQIGDDIVQPGPFDDNRTGQNRMGKLVRSHLGAAGDCAIASIEDRRFEPEILDLSVRVEAIGEPELGDKVIKSGRTTAVTHGIVSRVNTMTRIDYGGSVGERAIGGFEIEVDPANPPSNGEVSMGGDSGSVWMFKTNQGKAGKIMAGLHFAGEGPDNAHEHAIACYAKSVFEKLGISIKAEAAPQPPPGGGGTGVPVSGLGYNPNFLTTKVDLPKLSAAKLNDAFKLNNSELIRHMHFTLTQSKSRRFANYVAWNIDGGRLKRLSRSPKFVLDPLVPAQFQVGDDLYKNNRLDRGHIARRADVIWGGDAEAKQANSDSFFFTNITPQMDNFNQSGLGGIWGKIEDAVFEEVDVDDLKASVFGGPVFRTDDRVFRGVKIPREFFKVLAYVENGKLEARAFLLTQSLNQLEVLDLNQFRVFQVALGEVESRCGFKFPANLKTGDTFAERLERLAESAERPSLETLADIKW
ncbi:MAG: DNA/RNA non-specific endonuclease, partial [Acidobacteriota bacterium]